MTAASVVLSRTELDLPPLLISDDGTGVYTITEHGLGRPGVTGRLSYADTSMHVPGALLTQAVRDITSLPLEVLVQAPSYVALEAALDALDAAVWQFSYTATVTVGGVVRVWRCGPATWEPASGSTDWARAAQFLEVVSLTVPVQPYPEM